MNDALTVSQLTVSYDHSPVLWDLSLSLPQGHSIGLIGPNGAGKSTLVKAAMGMLQPLSGKISFFSEPLKCVRQRVAYVPQKGSVDWDFPITVIELILMGRYGRLGLCQRVREADRIAARHYLNVVGLQAFADRQINQLSGGQQQRAFIARALLQEADLYIMDEPFAGVDAATEKVLMHLMHDLRDKGKTLIIVHHDLRTVRKYFDWLVILNLRLVACGAVNDVFNAKMLRQAYGENYVLLDEALKLSQEPTLGM